MKVLKIVLVAGLLIANAVLIIQNQSLRQQVNVQSEPAPNRSAVIDPTYFGLYTYAGFGAWLAPEDADGRRTRSPLTLNVFLSSKTECPALLGEMEVFRRLEPVLSERGQRMIAICDFDDSLGVQEILEQERLQIHLMPLAFEDSNTTFADLGISSLSMPFKVIYDSAFSAIYVRGADNTPESQMDFERAVLRLSELVHGGQL